MTIGEFKRASPAIANAMTMFGISDEEYVARYNACLPLVFWSDGSTNTYGYHPDWLTLDAPIPHVDGTPVVGVEAS